MPDYSVYWGGAKKWLRYECDGPETTDADKSAHKLFWNEDLKQLRTAGCGPAEFDAAVDKNLEIHDGADACCQETCYNGGSICVSCCDDLADVGYLTVDGLGSPCDGDHTLDVHFERCGWYTANIPGPYLLLNLCHLSTNGDRVTEIKSGPGDCSEDFEFTTAACIDQGDPPADYCQKFGDQYFSTVHLIWSIAVA